MNGKSSSSHANRKSPAKASHRNQNGTFLHLFFLLEMGGGGGLVCFTKCLCEDVTELILLLDGEDSDEESEEDDEEETERPAAKTVLLSFLSLHSILSLLLHSYIPSLLPSLHLLKPYRTPTTHQRNT